MSTPSIPPSKPLRVYLAGPEVFLPDPVAAGNKKKSLCEKYGLIGLYPLDNSLKLNERRPMENGYLISAANEAMIRSSDAIIANLTPFRGISADVGTVYELGFAVALGKRVYGYTNVSSDLMARTCDYFGISRPQSSLEPVHDPMGMLIENFDLHDNLMLEGGIYARDGKFVVRDVKAPELFTCLEAFEDCVRSAAGSLQVQ